MCHKLWFLVLEEMEIELPVSLRQNCYLKSFYRFKTQIKYIHWKFVAAGTCNVTFIRVFLKKKGIFVQLDELDQLDKVVHAWITIYLQFQKAQKTL